MLENTSGTCILDALLTGSEFDDPAPDCDDSPDTVDQKSIRAACERRAIFLRGCFRTWRSFRNVESHGLLARGEHEAGAHLPADWRF